jgi:molybdopterin/thiamine biosynthesis adenylyltransferase
MQTYDYDVSSTELRQMLAAHRDRQTEPAVWRPSFFHISHDGDRSALAGLLEDQGLQVFDTLAVQLRDLIRTRHPAKKLVPAELEALVSEHLAGREEDEYGVWVYYPWSKRLVRTLEEEEFAELRTNRNRNKITPEEQAALAGKRVGVVGLSVGQMAALTLAIERSCGELRLADFDSIDLSNLNRIRTGIHSLNVPKVYVTAREIAEIDPYLKVTVFPEGITSGNAEAFLLHGGKLDVIVEECDSLDIKILIRHHARRHRIPVIMDTSDRGMLDIERFDLEPARPIFHGMAEGLDPDTLGGLTTREKAPFILRIYGSDTLSPRLRASMIEIDQTISTWPQLGSAVAQGGAAAAHAARCVALGQTANSGRFFLDIDELFAGGAAQTASVPSPAVSAPRVPCDDPVIRDLVSQAILAPSGGNAQPWKWLVDGDDVHLFLDRTRSGGFGDFECGVSYTALGCAAENFILAAHAARLEVRLLPFPDETDSGHAATLQLLRSNGGEVEPHWRDELHAQIPLRHTNRKIGVRRPLPAGDIEALAGAVRSIPSADIQWLTEEGQLDEAGEILGIADRLRILHPQAHGELFSELRWTREEAELTRDGIDVEDLCLAPSDLSGLEICRHWPSLDLVRHWRGGRNLEKMSRRWIAGSAAVGLITMPSSRPVDFFDGGRALQRLWLTATERNLAIQPMATLPYLFARLIRGSGVGFDEHTATELQSLRRVYERMFRVTPDTAEVLVFRVSFGENAGRRSHRRSIDDVLSVI